MLGTDVVVRKTFDVGFLTNGGNGDEKPNCPILEELSKK